VSAESPRRVVVAIDASAPSLAAAEAALEVAAALGVDLVGLFVEDLELLQLAELPLAVVADRLGAEPRAAESRALELELRAQAARARGAFERLLARRGVAGTFRVARGRVTAEILAAAGPGDVLVVGCVGHAVGTRALGGTARAVTRARGGAFLMPRRGVERAAALALLARLRPLVDAPLEELLLVDALAEGARLRERLNRRGTPLLLIA
jgi:nucleotide-binding universal stress UspA family protein